MKEAKSSYWQRVLDQAVDEDGQRRPFFSMAPMEAVTDTIFRRVVAKAGGPDLYYTEFTNAASMVHPEAKFSVQGRLAVAPGEQMPIAQIWGSTAAAIGGAAKLLPDLGYQAVDLNMGCPDGTVIKNEAGSDLIRHPDRADALIAAAKESGLPVSVKTRLGFYKIEEYQDWLTNILSQDIQVLTIHLRTRKEMSKVPAHYELIDDIVALRDQIAPQTLLQINGDIPNYQAGLDLAAAHPGVDGIMIGRGVLEDPFAFVKTNKQHDLAESIALLRYQLDLYDEVTAAGTSKHFEALKRYFKIYLRGFPHAAKLRQLLMDTKSTDEVRTLLAAHVDDLLALDD
ncbi:tRNA-dihydrouridine synthase [Leuconostocaceae bacterium ESL0958]|nr:tRNA-dihydrouridine synthase [Leuconostocaceae bacterium ESL0958]